MKQEITFAVQSGKTDSEILANLKKKYGADILLVPSFRGFNVLLWIVPLAAGLIAFGDLRSATSTSTAVKVSHTPA